MLNIIIGQALSIIATIITFLSYQVNNKKQLLITQTVATSFTCIAYFFLGASSGMLLNIVCIVRNIAFYVHKDNKRANGISSYCLAAVMVLLGALSWESWYSLLIIVALAANTVILSYGNPQLLRKSILVTSSMILVYNCFVFSLGGIANEGLSIISSIIGIIRFRNDLSNNPGAKTKPHDECCDAT